MIILKKSHFYKQFNIKREFIFYIEEGEVWKKINMDYLQLLE